MISRLWLSSPFPWLLHVQITQSRGKSNYRFSYRYRWSQWVEAFFKIWRKVISVMEERWSRSWERHVKIFKVLLKGLLEPRVWFMPFNSVLDLFQVYRMVFPMIIEPVLQWKSRQDQILYQAISMKWRRFVIFKMQSSYTGTRVSFQNIES